MRSCMWIVAWLLSFLVSQSLAKNEFTQRGLSLLEKDCLCACRHFKKKNGSNYGAEGSDEFCESIGFKHRWEPMFPGRKELGVGVGGLRALAFKSIIGDKNVVIFAFKEFEHEKLDYYIDDDYFQKIAMFGDEMWGSPDNAVSSYLYGYLGHSIVRFIRFYLGFDYYKHSCNFINEVMSRGKGPKRQAIFTGYGFGGSMAVLQAMRMEGSSGITFSAHGVRKVADYYMFESTATRRATNLVLDSDELLGEPATRQCTFQAPDMYRLTAGTNSVYSPHGFVEVDSARMCEDPS